MSPLLHGKSNGKRLQKWQISSSWTPKSLQIVTAVINQKMTASWKESCDKPGQCVENQRHYYADKGPYVQGYGLPNGHVQLWELDHKEGRMLKNWCLQTLVLEKTPESPLYNMEIKPVNHKEINPEYSLEGLMLKLKLQYFGHLTWTDDSLEKSLMLEKIEGRRRRGCQRMSWLDGITDAMNSELGQAPGDGEGRGGLVCCSHGVANSQTWLDGWTTATTHTHLGCVWKRQQRESSRRQEVKDVQFITKSAADHRQGVSLHPLLLNLQHTECPGGALQSHARPWSLDGPSSICNNDRKKLNAANPYHPGGHAGGMTASQKPALVATWLVSAHSPQIFAVRRRGATCQQSRVIFFSILVSCPGPPGGPRHIH